MLKRGGTAWWSTPASRPGWPRELGVETGHGRAPWRLTCPAACRKPSGGPGGALARPDRPASAPVRVLALGMVREYKGYDLLLEAARTVPGGERDDRRGAVGRGRGSGFASWPPTRRWAGRVQVRPGYLPGADVPALLAEHDVLALPYRHATASQNVVLGHGPRAAGAGHPGRHLRRRRAGRRRRALLGRAGGTVEALAAGLRRLTEARDAGARCGPACRPWNLRTPWAE